MRLVGAKVSHFKNITFADVQAHPTLNVFVGNNGEGKTNLLEAIHLAATLQPLRKADNQRALIRFGEPQSRVNARFQPGGGGMPLDVRVDVTPKGKRAHIGDKVVRDVASIAESIGVVAFVPADLELVRHGPDRRRRVLDRLCFQLNPSFLSAHRRYEKALSHRNRLLKAPRVDEQQLAAFTPGWADAADELVTARRDVVERWAPPMKTAVTDITRGALEAGMRYMTTGVADAKGDDARPYRDALLGALEARHTDERRRRFTPVGPHVDDLALTLGGRRARHLASQGEARALVLAMKIAELQLLAQWRKSAPLLMLDDVTGELDQTRAAAMFDTARAVGAQIFVTAPEKSGVLAQTQGAVWSLEQGAATLVDAG